MTVPATAVDFTMPTYRRWPVEFVAGSGARLADADGRTYIDMLAGIAVASVGHCHPRVVAAVAAQCARLVHVSNLFHTAPQRELARRLAEATGGMLSFFTNSGAEAVECAIKLARKHARTVRAVERPRIVCADGGFHGRTFGALAATGQPSKREPFAPMLEGFTHVPFGDAGALAEAMGDDVAAVLLEPVQGEAGVIVPGDGYLAAARALCDRWEALLVLDEVQTGLGRTGAMFAHAHFGVVPDVMCLAKALGGGLPIGACLATPEVARTFAFGDHGSTFAGGPVQAAAAVAVLDVIEEERLVERARTAGDRLADRLRAAFGPDAPVRGMGLLIAVDLPRPAARAVVEGALARGVVVNDATPSVIRLAPPLVIADDEIDAGAAVLGEVWREV